MKTLRSAVVLVTICLLAGFYGCAASDVKVEPAEALQPSQVKNPVDIVGQLGPEISLARENDLDILSPTWFPRAERFRR